VASAKAASRISLLRKKGLCRRPGGKAGDAEDGDCPEKLAVRAVAVPLDEEDLPGFRPFLCDRPGRRDGLDRAGVDAAAAQAVALFVPVAVAQQEVTADPEPSFAGLAPVRLDVAAGGL
jgi:hypothetical protein